MSHVTFVWQFVIVICNVILNSNPKFKRNENENEKVKSTTFNFDTKL